MPSVPSQQSTNTCTYSIREQLTVMNSCYYTYIVSLSALVQFKPCLCYCTKVTNVRSALKRVCMCVHVCVCMCVFACVCACVCGHPQCKNGGSLSVNSVANLASFPGCSHLLTACSIPTYCHGHPSTAETWYLLKRVLLRW